MFFHERFSHEHLLPALCVSRSSPVVSNRRRQSPRPCPLRVLTQLDHGWTRVLNPMAISHSPRCSVLYRSRVTRECAAHMGEDRED